MSFSFLDHPREKAKTSGADKAKRKSGSRGADKVQTAMCRSLLADLGLSDLETRVLVEWNPRMRSTAGRAFWPQGLIQLNPRLEEISPHEVRRTVLHELAHLIAYERHPYRAIKGHGREWRKACADVGIPGERATHQLELPTRTIQRKWSYECPACEKSFQRVRRFKSAVACFDCCREVYDGSYHEVFRLIERRITS